MDRRITTYLVVDYRTGKVACYTRPPRGVVGSQIPIKLNIVLKLPDEQKHELTATVTISETSVAGIMLEELAR